MALVTMRVLEGLERGRVYAYLSTPVSIGREDENDIQLNDDRVSRFHAKLQDDGGQVILTDLDSTNGTRVNGHAVQVKVLQSGDLVTIGRCVLLFGDLPGWHAAQALGEKTEPSQTAYFDSASPLPESDDFEFLAPPPGTLSDADQLFPQGAPPAPVDLRPLHRAQVSDILAFLHEQIGGVLSGAVEESARGSERSMRCSWDVWQQLVAAQATLAAYLRRISDPE